MAFSRVLCKLPSCPFGLYNPENLYAFRILKSGQLRSIKGTYLFELGHCVHDLFFLKNLNKKKTK